MRASAFVLVAFFGATVGLWADDPPPPQEIQYGQDVCAECNLAIEDSGYACELITSDSQVFKFDDIGDLLKYESEHSDLAVDVVYVQDASTKVLISADDAHWVKAESVKTPKGFGYHAFEAEADAQAFADDNGGTLTTFDAVSTGAEGTPDDSDTDSQP